MLASADWVTVNLGATSANTVTATIGDGTGPVADYSSVQVLVTGP